VLDLVPPPGAVEDGVAALPRPPAFVIPVLPPAGAGEPPSARPEEEEDWEEEEEEDQSEAAVSPSAPDKERDVPSGAGAAGLLPPPPEEEEDGLDLPPRYEEEEDVAEVNEVVERADLPPVELAPPAVEAEFSDVVERAYAGPQPSTPALGDPPQPEMRHPFEYLWLRAAIPELVVPDTPKSSGALWQPGSENEA
jgi:hypothetical protein